jgi:hypothetical protein
MALPPNFGEAVITRYHTRIVSLGTAVTFESHLHFLSFPAQSWFPLGKSSQSFAKRGYE